MIMMRKIIVFCIILFIFFAPKCSPAESGKKATKTNWNMFSQKAKSNHNNNKTDVLHSIIKVNSEKYGVDYSLIAAVIKVESNFNARSISKKGAKGLMQLMPATYRQYGVSNPFDPVQNVRAGTSFLKDMIDQFKRIDMALAAYNAGPGAIQKYKRIPPYDETRKYVKSVLYHYRKYKGKSKIDPTILKTKKDDHSSSDQIEQSEKKQLCRDENKYRKMILLKPSKKEAYYKLAEIYKQMDRPYNAIVVMQKLLKYESSPQKKQYIQDCIAQLSTKYRKMKGMKYIHLRRVK